MSFTDDELYDGVAIQLRGKRIRLREGRVSDDLLDNVLVREYFWPDGMPREAAALRVLRAMQEPIRRGDRYLDLSNATYRKRFGLLQLPVMVADCDITPLDEPHFAFFRLPDCFQCNEVEGKIKLIMENLNRKGFSFVEQLRELVRLARESK